MLVGTAAKWPKKPTLGLCYRQIVDTGDSPPHFASLIEFPILVAVAAKPIAAVVVPLVSKTHGNAIVAESPKLLDQTIIEFAAPLARQERYDGVPASGRRLAVASAATPSNCSTPWRPTGVTIPNSTR